MSGHGEGDAPSPRTDLILAAVFLCFGVAVVAASAAMPTFTDQGTPLYVAPGLVPAFHGGMIGLLSVILAARSMARGALRPAGAHAAVPWRNITRIALATVLAVGFAGGLVGQMPFWLAATLFVFAFIMAFEWEPGLPARTVARNAAIGAAIGLVTGIGITLLFERLFLIRMP